MITLLTGNKGSGKTKKLIEMVGSALEKSQGNVVVIEKGQKLTFDISHDARLIDSDAYDIKGADALCGFVSGICAGNYDVTDIFVDGTLTITGTGAEALEVIVPEMEKLSKASNTNIILSVSATEEEIPAAAKEYIA